MLCRIVLALVMFVAVDGWATQSMAQRDRDGERRGRGQNWVLLGTHSVDLKKDEDRLNVGASKGRLRSIVVVATDRLIDISRVTIATDGEQHVHRERMRLADGDHSRPINFSREGQVVRHVELSYRHHIGAAGPAKVELWGLKSWYDDTPVARSEPPPKIATPAPKAVTAATQFEEEMAGSGAVLFGVHQVGSETEHEVFKLGREYGRFGRLRLRASGSAVGIKQLRVIYAGGEPDILAVDAEIPDDGRSAWLDLKGDRFIREIHFVYSSLARSQARLEVYGEYAENWYKPGAGTGAYSAANDGWLYLGGQSPLFVSIRRGLGYETDIVSVARNRGFRSLRLDVKNRAITLNQITVIYSDGSSDIFADRQRVDGGSTYGPVELKSRRPVKEIQVSYRSRIFDSQAEGSGHAFVEFWAK